MAGHEDPTSEQRLLATFDAVTRWREYVSAPRLVAARSRLDVDDAVFPVLPLSHLAWFGIAHAVDHLEMYLDALVVQGKSYALAPRPWPAPRSWAHHTLCGFSMPTPATSDSGGRCGSRTRSSSRNVRRCGIWVRLVMETPRR